MGLSWLMIGSLVLLLLPNKLLSQSDTTAFEITTFNAQDPSLTYQGDARVYPQFLSLIAYRDLFPSIPLQYNVGRVLYTPQVRLWDEAGRRQANFQTEFHCEISNSYVFELGDGIAFFIAPAGTTIPANSTGGHLGLYDRSGTSPGPVFAVELDVFQNSWDPSYHHVGININSRNSVAVKRLNSTSTQPLLYSLDVRITYIARERLISVVVTTLRLPANTTTLEHTFDLKTLLPEWVQIGISGSTGQEIAFLNVRSWSFISFMVSDDDVANTDDVRQYV